MILQNSPVSIWLGLKNYKMVKKLKKVVAAYVDKVGISTAIEHSTKGVDGLLVLIEKGGEVEIEGRKDEITAILGFKLAVIEYLYFHHDTTDKAIEFGETLL